MNSMKSRSMYNVTSDSNIYCIKCMGIQKKNFETISNSRPIKMACTKCLKFSFTMLCKDQSKLEHDEVREKVSKMEEENL